MRRRFIGDIVCSDMGKDIPTKQDLLKAQTDLLWAADSGKLDSLDCPSCHRQTVSVWFTHPKPDIYREWFVCSSCSFSFRAQISGIPKHYSESRINQKLQEYDVDLLAKIKF